MVTKFNSSEIKAIEQALEFAVKQVADHFGIVIEIGTCRYNANLFKTTIEGKTKAYAETCSEKASSTSDGGIEVGKTLFVIRGTMYRVVDYKPSRSKYPYVAEGPKGGRWRFSRELIINSKVV